MVCDRKQGSTLFLRSVAQPALLYSKVKRVLAVICKLSHSLIVTAYLSMFEFIYFPFCRCQSVEWSIDIRHRS